MLRKGTIFWMNTFCAFHACMAISTDDTLHRIESEFRQHLQQTIQCIFIFRNSPYQCDALVYSLAYSLAYWLSLCVCMLCMHVSVQFNNQLLNAYFECLTYLHLQLFVRLVLCIDYSIVALFVTCNTYAKTQCHIHTFTYTYTHKWSKAKEIHKKHSELASKNGVQRCLCSLFFYHQIFMHEVLLSKNFGNTLLV